MDGTVAKERVDQRVEFFRHGLGAEAKEAVTRVLDGLFLTTGAEVYAFEREFAAYLELPHVVAVSSCTQAEHLSLLALGIQPGDEVVTTALTFIATSTAILHAGAVPVFVDVEASTGNIDPAQVEQAITPRTKAIVCVHLYGTMCDMQALRAIADRRGLLLIEDAAHCVEGTRDGLRVGQAADAVCFSHYATKVLTSAEGGSIGVSDLAVAEKLGALRLHGMSKNAADRYQGAYQHWDMVELGYKANMTNIQGALLRTQLPGIDARRDRREDIARRYDEFVDSRPELDRPIVPAGSRAGRHLYTIWTEPSRRDAYLAYLGSRGVGCAVNYRAIHNLTWMREHVEQRFPLAEAERIGDRTISIPFYESLTDGEIEYVCDVLRDAAAEA